MQSQPVPSFGSLISALFLVAGTCIGGGMLALPVATGISGFFPSIITMAICWASMTATALLLMEVSLWMEEGVHIITMTSRLLGRYGKMIAWVLYLFICYASLVAYTAGGGIQIMNLIHSILDFPISQGVGCLLFVLVFGGVLYLGHYVVGRVNAVLFIAMIVAYFCLVTVGIGEIKPHLLKHKNWSTAVLALPLLLTAFSFQTMVPSLTPYLKRHIKSLRIAIIGGTALTFVVYLIWQSLILGIVPAHGENGLIAALEKGQSATYFLGEHVENSFVSSVAEYFAFFALVTSFLGIALGLFDFLSDGLKIKEKGVGNVVLAILIAVPTLFFAIYFERIFLVALETTGGFGDAILNGIIPVLMVWVGRYQLGYTQSRTIPGGKPVLILLLIFFSFVLIFTALMQLNQIDSLTKLNLTFEPVS